MTIKKRKSFFVLDKNCTLWEEIATADELLSESWVVVVTREGLSLALEVASNFTHEYWDLVHKNMRN